MGYHFREQESFVRIVELTPRLRHRIEHTIEHLVSIPDQFDGDEPSQGWVRASALHEIKLKPCLGRQGCQPFGLAFVLHRLAAFRRT